MTSMYRAPVLPTFAALLALVTSHAALADTTGTVAARVLSAKPVYAQVQVPQQVCWDDVQQAPAQGSGAGALMGAIAGGAMGNAIGGGSGQVLATGLGIFGGAILGNRIETQGQGVRTQQVRRCEQQVSLQNQVVAYDVVYELHGQQYSTQLDEAPGRTIDVDVTVQPSGYAPAGMNGAVSNTTYYTETVPVTVVGSPTWVIQAGSSYYPSHAPHWRGSHPSFRDKHHHASPPRPHARPSGVIRVPGRDTRPPHADRRGRGGQGERPGHSR